jgi:hypothetical protein
MHRSPCINIALHKHQSEILKRKDELQVWQEGLEWILWLGLGVQSRSDSYKRANERSGCIRRGGSVGQLMTAVPRRRIVL